MKTLRPTDRKNPYFKFGPGDQIIIKDPRKLPCPVLEIEQVWLDYAPPPFLGQRYMYQCRDIDTGQCLHLETEQVGKSYVRYEGSTED